MPVGKQSLAAEDECNLTFVGLVCDSTLIPFQTLKYWLHWFIDIRLEADYALKKIVCTVIGLDTTVCMYLNLHSE